MSLYTELIFNSNNTKILTISMFIKIIIITTLTSCNPNNHYHQHLKPFFITLINISMTQKNSEIWWLQAWLASVCWVWYPWASEKRLPGQQLHPDGAVPHPVRPVISMMAESASDLIKTIIFLLVLLQVGVHDKSFPRVKEDQGRLEKWLERDGWQLHKRLSERTYKWKR